VARVHAQVAATAPQALQTLDDGREDALVRLAYPEAVRVRLRPTHGVERLNAELRRRERAIRIFPPRGLGPLAVGGRVAGDPRAMGDGAALPEPDELPRVGDGREP